MIAPIRRRALFFGAAPIWHDGDVLGRQLLFVKCKCLGAPAAEIQVGMEMHADSPRSGGPRRHHAAAPELGGGKGEKNLNGKQGLC